MEKMTGNECFYYNNSSTGYLLNDFWQWSASDLLNNTQRGVLAEFIVAKALDIETYSPRLDWEPYDLLFRGNLRIEVKASAYVQSWSQTADSKLRFSIRPTQVRDGEAGRSEDKIRQSDMYIFCVFAEKDRAHADPMNLDKWEFYPVLTREINEMLEAQQTASMSTILGLHPEAYDYGSLLDAVLWLSSDRLDSHARERIEEHRAHKRANTGTG